MSIFDDVQNLAQDYAATVDGFNAAERAADEIQKAVCSRLEAEKAQAAERAATLEARISDPGTTPTARSMYRAELDRLQARSFAATEAETAAFLKALTEAETAVKDLYALRAKLQDALNTARDELTDIRAATLGDKSHGLRENWIASRREKFFQLEG